jgi:CheY-like chemotaxis protein/HPt (histidine-containing phosphotransfer) domain-containing protein
VIDDDEDARLIVAGMLTELGMRAETAPTGEGGLEAVTAADRAADPYDLLIIDWQLPRLDGIETASRLQALDLSVHPTFLVMTAYGDRLPREQAELAGIHRVMAKPVTPSVLHDTLAEIILPLQGQAQPISVMKEELAKRQGGHILLVEDNPINQEVAQALLESLGMQVSLADNGQTAVEMAGAAAFDLVFMDIQMPVMDGLEATRVIRRLPGWESIPIVALTANAFREDGERCFQAGMNDHIAKPVEHKALQELLIRWMPARQLSVSSEPSADRSTIRIKEDDTLLAALEAIDGLDAAAGLRRMVGNQDRYIRVLTRFIDDYGGAGDVLGELAVSGFTSVLRAKSHALKGAAATLGMARIQQAAAELEAMCKTGETRAAIEYQVNLVRQELAELTTALAKVLPVPSPRPVVPSALDVDELAGTLARLADLLRKGDFAATDLFEQARPGLYAACGPLAEQLDRHIQALEYEEAGRIVQELYILCSHICQSPMDT